MSEAQYFTSANEDVFGGIELDAAVPGFLLRTGTRTLDARGCRAMLPAGGTATLHQRVNAFFDAAPAGLPLLVGALPFDPTGWDALYQPVSLMNTLPSGGNRVPAFVGDIRSEPTPDAYARAVEHALDTLANPYTPLRKVVLARSLHVNATAPIDPHALALRLGQDAGVAPFVAALPGDPRRPPAWLVGASPELLVSRQGQAVCSHPLAGSARRSADPVEDAAAAEALLGSAKDHDEHRYVVEAIVEALTPWCSDIRAPKAPELHSTASMWHLGTRIEATLRDPSTPVAALVAALHPTPAVCGTPRDDAMYSIRRLEPNPRGFYAGAVGWMDADGDGEWYVAIRCARVQGAHAQVFAGAGIVTGSQPEFEVAETAAKFTALLSALGVGHVASTENVS